MFHVVVGSSDGLVAWLRPLRAPASYLVACLAVGACGDGTGSLELTLSLPSQADLRPAGMTTVTLTVIEVTQPKPPSFAVGPNQTVNENAPEQSVAVWATGIAAGTPAPGDPVVLTFVVTVDRAELFSVLPTITAQGVLSYALTKLSTRRRELQHRNAVNR